MAVGGEYIQVTVSNPHRTTAILKQHNVLVAYYLKRGAREFDALTSEWLDDLKRP